MIELPKPHLEQTGTARPQWRTGRRDPLKPVFVGHTTQGGRTATAAKAAGFISNRSEAGSYHLVGDERQIIYLVDFDNEAFGDRTGSNRWAIHGSLAMDAVEWSEPGFASSVRGSNLVDTFAQMVALSALHFVNEGLLRAADYLAHDRTWPTAPTSGIGVTSHALRDPTRRTDPGADFPWGQAQRLTAHYCRNPHLITKLYEGAPMPTSERNEYVAAVQEWLQSSGSASSSERAYVDGKMGPKTLSDLMAVLNTKPGKSDAFEAWADLQRDKAAAQVALDRAESALSNMVATVTKGIG